MQDSVHFIYCPTTGSRLLTPSDAAGLVPLVIWHNSCIHAIGVSLMVSAAESGSWCRDGARAIAIHVATSLGGVAWDAQGVVSVVVPAWGANEAYQLMRESLAATRGAAIDVSSPTAAILLGIAVPKMPESEPVEWRREVHEESQMITIGEHVIKAPFDWGLPVIPRGSEIVDEADKIGVAV